MSQSAVWDPTQYHRYGDLRLRPALELFSRISIETPSLVHDIGTGGGEIARLMAQRWSDARVIGSDSSGEMLGKAAESRRRSSGACSTSPIGTRNRSTTSSTATPSSIGSVITPTYFPVS